MSGASGDDSSSSSPVGELFVKPKMTAKKRERSLFLEFFKRSINEDGSGKSVSKEDIF